MTRDERLDEACAIRCQQEPYFAPCWRSARALLRGAIFGADRLRFANGIEVHDGHCGCQGLTQCLHERAYQLYAGGGDD